MKYSNFTHEEFRIVREDINNLDAIERVAIQLCNPAKLAADPVYLAWCKLPSMGPDNDYNGIRSTAVSLMREWESKVMTPARLVRSMGLF
jgi:hypothetical protein